MPIMNKFPLRQLHLFKTYTCHFKRLQFSVVLKSCSLTILILFFFLCFKDTSATNISVDVPPSYLILEDYIRGKYDICSVFKWEDYSQLLDKLSGEKFEVLTINDMRSTYDKSKVIVGLRHDVDFNPFKALEMARMENIYGFRATYFMLASAEYFGKITDKRFGAINRNRIPD